MERITIATDDPYKEGIRDYYSGLCDRARPYFLEDKDDLWEAGFRAAYGDGEIGGYGIAKINRPRSRREKFLIPSPDEDHLPPVYQRSGTEATVCFVYSLDAALIAAAAIAQGPAVKELLSVPTRFGTLILTNAPHLDWKVSMPRAGPHDPGSDKLLDPSSAPVFPA